MRLESLTQLVENRLAAVIRMASRAYRTAGFVGAYGHVSGRLTATTFLVAPPKAPATIGTEPCDIVHTTGALPDGVLGEVRAHRQIYHRRPDVGGICRFYSEAIMTLSVLGIMPRSRDVFSAFFHPQPTYWNDTRLLRDDGLANGVAETLSDGRAIVLRGNGAIAVGASVSEALLLAWMLNHAARVELALLQPGAAAAALVLTDQQANELATLGAREAERMWDYLTLGDPEMLVSAAG